MLRYDSTSGLLQEDDGKWVLYDDAQKRIAELETALTEIRYIADGAIKIQPIYAIADSALSEGGADTSP